uniref:NTF2 domain-containing protein n=1 Tax=Oryctolagus cuniculus TaxID=9986 RepID=A0A5F9CLB3_RABIT
MGPPPTWETRRNFIQHYYQLFDNDRTHLGAIYIDHQGTGKLDHTDSCTISMVVDQLKADKDPIMEFHLMFLLQDMKDAWVCTSDMSRLALHNLLPARYSVLFLPPSSSRLYSHFSRCSKYHTEMSRTVVGVGAQNCCHQGIVHVWALD